MGAPVPEIDAAENPSAEALLSSLKTIAAKERRKHASVFNYWLSIRGNRAFPPIRDLDPLEISDAGPFSVLLDMIGGGENAEIRHLGEAIRAGIDVERLSDAPNPSLLSCIHSKLPIVAACRQPFAFEDEFATEEGTRRCWVTLMPFSSTGTWIDFVYGFVSLDGDSAASEEDPATEEAASAEEEQGPEEMTAEPLTVPLRPFYDEPEAAEATTEPAEAAPEVHGELPEPEAEPEYVSEQFEQAPDMLGEESEPGSEAGDESGPATGPTKPGFSAKFFDGLASVGFHGRIAQATPSDRPPASPEHAETAAPAEPLAEDEPEQPTFEAEGDLQSKLSEVRAKAEEARMALIRSNAALYEGLSAAYDFALDAEQEPEQYLRLVEEQGLKIQLRSPMKPVVKLGFDGTCDEATIAQLEAVLVWALKMELPRGSLAERIEAEGGIGQILNGQ